jgi:hypothetical protein
MLLQMALGWHDLAERAEQQKLSPDPGAAGSDRA